MYGLLGKNLSHSFSVYVHETLNDSINYELYETLDVGAFLKTAPFKGLNVTIPYKKDVIEHLDFLDESVKETGVVNTIVRKDDKLHGFNTDYTALKTLVLNHYPKNRNATITILGNGATMSSLKKVLASLNYQNIHVCARNPKAGQRALKDIPQDTNVLINATPLGMYPKSEGSFEIDFDALKDCTLVHDLIYNPFQSNLILDAKAHDIKTMNGLSLLFTQAYHAQKHFGIAKSVNLEKTIRTFQRNFMNIVFIGLPFSGKSHYGRRLSKMSDKPFIDTDTQIEQYTNQSISNIFMTKGEPYFREIEQQIVKQTAKKHRQIIAPGGGVILDHDTMIALKQNAFVIYLEMDEAMMENRTLKNRPLIKSLDDWKLLKREREPLYKYYADAIIKKDTLDETIILKKITEALDAYFNH